MNNYPDIENDGMNGAVMVSMERYEELIMLETKVKIMTEFMTKDGYFSDSTARVLFGIPEKKAEEKKDA